MTKNIKIYHNYQDTKKETYSQVVNKWKKYADFMKNNTNSTRIQKWSFSNGMYKYFNNPGEKITDSNPYLNYIDLDEFNLLIKNQPLPPDPPAFNNPNRPNFFSTMMDEYIDDSSNFKNYLTTSFNKIREQSQNINVPSPSFNKELNLQKLKNDIFNFSKKLGFKSIGVTKIDRRFISIESDDEILYETIIILGYEIPKDIIARYPEPKHSTAAYYGYAHCAKYIHDIANFIRSKGYDCRPRCWEGFIKYPVLAVNAGMGNFSTFGICHTPEVGTRLKYASIIIDAELPLDYPRDFNIEEFCARCRMCQKSCPANAIPKEESRYMGSIRRVTDHIKCFESMATKHECFQCIKTCPISMLGYENVVESSLPPYYQYNTVYKKEDLYNYKFEGDFNDKKF